jgi:hypothetical protein
MRPYANPALYKIDVHGKPMKLFHKHFAEDSLCRLSMIHAHRNDTHGIPETVLLSEIRVAI